MFERLPGLDEEYQEVLEQLGDPAVLSDQRRLRDVSRRQKELEPIVSAWQGYRQASDDREAARTMLRETSGLGSDEREMLRSELEEAESRMRVLEDELKVLLLPKDPNDGKNVILEIRGAEGGEEANLFARDLYDMYVRYAERHSLAVDTLSSDPSERGGFNEVTFLVKGPDAWSRFKYEGGPHRVQRVPVTESQGRVHTSSATVTVLPEAEEVDVQLDDKDLKIDVYRSTGPGGQSVNTTDSAVRITHLPTGIVVAMQDEKSQIQNRAKALQVLRARLLKAEQDRQTSELSELRRGQVGGGGRSEKIRTYNFKDNRVTDHRIGLTLHKLDKILMGDLDDVVDGLRADERARQLAGDVNWSDAYTGVCRRLGSDRDARWIVEEAAGGRWPGIARRPVEASAAAWLKGMVARREAGEPLQYVLGRWPFRTVEVRVDQRVLIPRPETEQVVEVALAAYEGLRGVVVDLGTGSGAVALAVAHERPDTEVWATDRFPEALEVAGANLSGTGVRLAQGDWWSALPDELRRKVDLAIANPPYLSVGEMRSLDPAVARWEPRAALEAGPDGLEAVTAIIHCSREWLADDGVLAVELAPHQAAEACRRAQSAGLVGVEIRPDLAGLDRALVARAPAKVPVGRR